MSVLLMVSDDLVHICPNALQMLTCRSYIGVGISAVKRLLGANAVAWMQMYSEPWLVVAKKFLSQNNIKLISPEYFSLLYTCMKHKHVQSTRFCHLLWPHAWSNVVILVKCPLKFGTADVHFIGSSNITNDGTAISYLLKYRILPN